MIPYRTSREGRLTGTDLPDLLELAGQFSAGEIIRARSALARASLARRKLKT